MSAQKDTERLTRLEELLEKNDRKGSRICWIRWNPDSRFGYQIDDAREDVRWMIYEIKRLREEHRELKEFVDMYRNEMTREIR